MKHAWGYATDQRLREENQDSHGVFEFDGFTLAIVCDGMGGHAGGAEASAIAVRTVWETMTELQGRPVGPSLQKAIHAANEAIYKAARKHRKFMGMGTTVVACALEGNIAHIAHVGDSRLYAVREGEAHLLTRDHTMVNLFVEAELLSPEDAAAHPEAHVLARSLGVEQTVEVDLQDPLELEPGDVLVLCSDGVHGPLSDAEFGEIDWGHLPHGCDRVLDRVRDHDGDDNATLAVLGIDLPESPAIAPTPPPPPIDLERRAQEVDEDKEVEAGDERHEPRPPMLYDEAQAAVAEAEGAAAAEAAAELIEVEELEEIEVEPLEEVGDVEGAEAEAEAEATARHLAEEARRSTRRKAVAVAAALVLVLAVGGIGVGVSQMGEGPSPTGPDRQQAEFDVVSPTVADPVPPEPGEQAPPEPTADTDDAVAIVETPPEPVSDDDWVYEPDMPATLRHPPHQPVQFDRPAPGGPLNVAVVKAARANDCARALEATRRAIRNSMDYGELYDEVWDCFDRTHHEPLASTPARDLAAFRALLPHFQGPPNDDPRFTAYPAWYRPPTGGIEYRTRAWVVSTEEDHFAEATLDLLGDEAVADQFMRDALVEAQAAAGLAGLDPTPMDMLARRVYHATLLVTGRPGELIEAHRPEQKKIVEALLDEATGRAWSDPTRLAEAPPELRDAIEVARGDQSVPRAWRSVAANPKPEPAPEPGPEEAADTDLAPIVHRTGP